MEITTLDNFIAEYCLCKNVAVVRIKLTETLTEEEKQDLLSFYEGKLVDEYYSAIKNTTEAFLTYKTNTDAFMDAENTFPSKRELDAEYGDNHKKWVYCSVYNKEGQLTWENY